MGAVECIHGLDIAVCDVCTPRTVAAPAPRAGAQRRSRPAPPTGARRAQGQGAAAVRSAAADRVYLTVQADEVVEALETGEEAAWRIEAPSEVLAGRLVVVAMRDGLVPQLVAVPNEPSRRAVRDALAAAGRDIRVVVQPAWFARA